MDRENPRSLACVMDALSHAIGALPLAPHQSSLSRLIDVDALLPDLVALCERDTEGHFRALLNVTERAYALGRTLSDEIGRRYFTHAQVFKSLQA